MEKYLITGEVFDWKRTYALFSSGEYFIINYNKISPIINPSENDLRAIKQLNEKSFKEKILGIRDNYYFSLQFNDTNDDLRIISNIKCFKDPLYISYEYEHYKSLYLSK